MSVWERTGWYYEATVEFVLPFDFDGQSILVTRRLGFISYHLIRWYHGEAKLEQMALAEPDPLRFRW